MSVSISNPFTASNVKHKLGKLLNKRCVIITEYDPTFKVVYLGNVLTQWAKGDACLEKPLATLWKNYVQNMKHEIVMKVTVTNSGLKASTKEHGLTEYWSNRITFCAAPKQYPKLFCWVYRHEGRRMKQELRCHAVLCDREDRARAMAEQLSQRLTSALQEFRREKLSRQKARLSLANSCFENPTIPRRKLLLSTGSTNFRPPLERSKSAPKLTSIEEIVEEEFEEDLDDDDYYDEDFIGCTGSVISEVESSSDIVPDDVDSLSDHFHHSSNGHDTDSLDSVDELLPHVRHKKPLKLIDEAVDEEDNVSDESGYSEEKDSYKEDTSVTSYKM